MTKEVREVSYSLLAESISIKAIRRGKINVLYCVMSNEWLKESPTAMACKIGRHDRKLLQIKNRQDRTKLDSTLIPNRIPIKI